MLLIFSYFTLAEYLLNQHPKWAGKYKSLGNKLINNFYLAPKKYWI